MSDSSTSIVSARSVYPNPEKKAQEIVDWLLKLKVIKPTRTNCVLGSDFGYPMGDGAAALVDEPEYLPYDLLTSGLEVITKNTIFHTGGNGMDSFNCPNCDADLVDDDLGDFFNQYIENGNAILTCPSCGLANDINDYLSEPESGVSNLGFTFWNWPPLKESITDEFEQRLGCKVKIVECHI